MSKMKFSLLPMLFAALFFGSSASAQSSGQSSEFGLFVEPMITYELGDTSVNFPQPFSDSTGTLRGFGIGGRVGGHVSEAVFLALDARYSMPQFKDSAVEYDAKATSMNWGPVVGLQMPNVGMRVWAAYVLGGELDPESSGAFDVKFTEPAGFRLGAGFRVMSASLNLEYQELKYGKSMLEEAGPISGTSENMNLTGKSWIGSVSFPLEF